MSADPSFPSGLGGVIPLGPGMPARSPAPEALPPPRTATIPDHLPEPYEPVVLPPAPADPDERLPDGFVRLAVHRAYDGRGRELFGLTGHGGGLELAPGPADTRLRPEDIALSNVRRDGFAPSEFFHAVAEWSDGQEELVRWINDLRARHGTALQLVIWDDTDYDIPWELLRLAADPRRGLAAGILGALVTVVRWTTIRKAGTTPLGRPAACSGQVLGYYAEPMSRDRQVFERFVHTAHSGSTRTFLDDLARSDLGAGLVYMGCHATYGPKLHHLRLDTVTWSELNAQPMPALDGGRTLVCLNACHSARLVYNTARGENALRGFAELFLRKGAGGCIATSGQVGDDIAHTLVRELMERIGADPDLPVAHALREFRAAAAARLPDPLPFLYDADGRVDTAGQQRLLPFLHSFMFLYFGHPQTTLRLSVRARESTA